MPCLLLNVFASISVATVTNINFAENLSSATKVKLYFRIKMVFIDAENTSEMYFYEKDRIASFKSWPFSDKHVCNIQRVRIFVCRKCHKFLFDL